MVNTESNSQDRIPHGLYDKVVLRIEKEQRRKTARLHLAAAAFFFAALAVLMIPVWNLFWKGIAASGFGQYLSLLFSDSRTVAGHWREFGLGLLGALPAVKVAALLTVLLAMLFTARVIYRNQKIIYR